MSKQMNALLHTLPKMICAYLKDENVVHYCMMAKDEYGWDFNTNCEGDICKCERKDD